MFDGTLAEDEYAKSYWLASPGVYAVPGEDCGFGPGAVAYGGVGRGRDSFVSGGGFYEYWFGVRPVDSINCGYIVNDYIRDNIETNCCPFVFKYDKIKIDEYIC